MLLGPVFLFELSVYIKSDISSGVAGVMKKDSAFGFLRLSEKFLFVGVSYVFLEFFAYALVFDLL